jgi:dynein heavy chain
VDISERLEDDRTPPQHVFYQEGERVNALLAVMKKAFGELDLGLQGALSMTESMQTAPTLRLASLCISV